MAHYQTLQRVKFGGKTLPPKEVIEAADDDKDIADLLSLGAIVAVTPDPETADTLEGEALQEAIITAVKGLDPATGFTQGGAPKVDAVSAALGQAVTGAQVKAAWAAMSKEQGGE